MTKQKRTRIQFLGLVLTSIIIAALTYGFAAAKTNYASPGLFGGNYGVLAPYEVIKVSYVLDLEDPTTFSAVEFIITETDLVEKAGVSANRNGQITWAEGCEKSGAFWVCSFADKLSVLEADWLHID